MFQKKTEATKARRGKYLSHAFPIQNGMKQVDALSSWLLNVALKYVIGKIQENREGVESNGTHQSLVCVDVNILDENIKDINKDTSPVRR
jgi:hypothetical protein